MFSFKVNAYLSVCFLHLTARQTAAEGNLDDWLADDVLLGTRAHTSTLDARRYPAAFTGKTGKAALSGHSARSGKNSRYGSSGIGGASTSLLGSTAHSEEKLLKEQSDKLRAHMVSAMSEGLAEQKRQELFAHFQEQKDGKSDAKIVPGTEQKGDNLFDVVILLYWKIYNVRFNHFHIFNI